MKKCKCKEIIMENHSIEELKNLLCEQHKNNFIDLIGQLPDL